MLGCKELAVLSEDDFEGSNEAHQIFMDVFCGRNVAGGASNDSGCFVTRNIAGFGFGPLNYSVCISRYYLDTSAKRMKRSDGGKLSVPRNEHSIGEKCGQLSAPGNDSSNGEKSLEPTPFTLDAITTTVSNNSMTDLYSRLRGHVNYLLKAAGWVVEKKKVGKNRCVHTTYKSPAGKNFTAFYKIWDLFGKSLFAGNYKMVQQEDGKQWTDIKEFGSDLSEALTDFEKVDCIQMEPSYAVVRKWSLIDPFVTVVMVKKQILILRKGMPVKVATTVVSDLKDSRLSLADDLAQGSMALELGQANSKGNVKALEIFTLADAFPEFENARKKLAQSGYSGTAASNFKMDLTSGTTVTWLTKKRRKRKL